jgi:hypothetical protein
MISRGDKMTVIECENCKQRYEFIEGDTPDKYAFLCSDECIADNVQRLKTHKNHNDYSDEFYESSKTKPTTLDDYNFHRVADVKVAGMTAVMTKITHKRTKAVRYSCRLPLVATAKSQKEAIREVKFLMTLVQRLRIDEDKK